MREHRQHGGPSRSASRPRRTSAAWTSTKSGAHIDKLRHLQSRGIDQFAVYDMHDNRESTTDSYRTKTIPAIHA
ncbi:hypothetical protein [Streptomyces sp. McG3]|uniref:hypothetical protein n=1 Tax=Streptomyces sp. McG3 TaxID=2725483 RepID=UPI001BE51208|nr:hypothetical protein [Streptomyces sp. McG3]MBT2897198.1 hypothetical protein [Streptomyces sp. McG3]